MASEHNYLEMAQQLAARPYLTVVFRDQTTDDEPIYVAINPELKGCIAQGDTPEEARQNLDETRIDFIFYMLEDGLSIPEPQPIDNAVIHYPDSDIQAYDTGPIRKLPGDVDAVIRY